jgi:hypothetical protein
MSRNVLAVLIPAAVLLAACDNGPSTGELTVELTDAPSDMIASATAYISTVYVIRGGDSTGPRDTISNTPQSYNLLSLAGGLTATLGTATLNTGNISQVRLVVDSATVTLKAPLTFNDGSSTRTLPIPSGMQSGIKVNFAGSLNVVPGETIVVVDFDVSRSFKFQGSPTNPNGVLFTPVLHGAIKDASGSISGTVTPASSHATVFAILGASDTVRVAFADTLSGAYTLHFLAAGTYTVAVQGTGVVGSKSVVLPVAKDTTGINFP